MKFVCESLHSFRKLNENMEQAKKAFAEEGFDENSDKWKEFINIFGGDPELMGKFAEWILADKDEQRRAEAFEDIQEIYKEAKENKIKLELGSFVSLRDFRRKIGKEIQDQKDRSREEKFSKEKEDLNQAIQNENIIIKRLKLLKVEKDKRGLYCTQDVKNSPDKTKKGSGLYIWTDLPYLYNWSGDPADLKINFKFGQYGAFAKAVEAINDEDSVGGKTAGETISGYAGTYMSPKVILFIKNLNDYLSTPDHKYKDAYEVEHAVQHALKDSKWSNPRELKSTEVFRGGSLKDLIEIINKVVSGTERNEFKPREEQKTGIDKITEYLKQPDHKEFLLAAKMRYGKNVTVLNAIKKLNELSDDYKNCLVITYKPSVFSSLKDDVEKFGDFKDFEVVDIRKESKIPETSDKVRIFISSAQYALYGGSKDINESEQNIYELTPDEEVEALQKTAYDDYEKNLDKLKKIHFGVIMADEYHYGTKSANFQNLLKQLSYDKIIYVSGTAMKDMATGKFDETQVYNYTYIDEQKQKKLELKKKEKNPDGYYPHIDMPSMNFYKMELSPAAKRLAENSELYSQDQGFSFTKFIDVDETKLANKTENQIKRFKHIITKYVPKASFEGFTANGFEDFVKKSIQILGNKHVGVKVRIKVTLNNANYTSLPNYTPFIELMSVPKADSTLSINTAMDKMVKDKPDQETTSTTNPFAVANLASAQNDVIGLQAGYPTSDAWKAASDPDALPFG